ncbi:hypothetical protein [Streptomyces antimicrobicus]|uniref:Integral membrane protein n=1 Tax=Streptomyces antimicrobicus TaxID=2883108 RepID=A0ABS8BD46_9ACTN|nr:hypothetical protein [Streptomyces antimicrobicus]MCB5182530.1 hypothetical protein [Streptomyces antimicrobicus]
MPRRDLPPPPPPAHLRGRLDETAVRADRARFLRELGRQELGPGRLVLLWAVAAVVALGWSCVGLALMSFEQDRRLEDLVGVVYAVLGAGVLVPAGFWFAWGARRDRQVRRLLSAWAAAAPDPVADGPLRAPGRSLAWLLVSCVPGAAGLWLALGTALRARPGVTTYGEVTYLMGLGTILWLTGLLGAAKAAAHYRWALRVLTPRAPGRRSASTEHLPPG